MKLTRRALLGAATATAAATTAACALPTGGAGGDVAPLAQHKPAVLDFWGGPSAVQRKAQVDAWNEKYPRLNVRFQTVSGVGAGVEALRAFSAQVAAGRGPQVVDFDRFQVAGYVNWKMLEPIDQLARRDKYDLGAFTPAVLGEATGLDKKLYGLPSGVDARLLYWHKQAFAEAGLDPEQPPSTWEDLAAFAARLTKIGGRPAPERLGFHTQEGQSTLHLFAWQNEGGFLSADGKTATLGQPQNVEALQAVVGVMKAQGEWAQAKAFQDAWATQPGSAFIGGQLAMQYEVNDWAGGTIARQQPQLAFGVAAPPRRRASDPPLTWSGGYSYVASRNANDLDVAWQLMKWLVGEEGWSVAHESGAAAARAGGGIYLAGMSGQPAIDRKMAAAYRTGVPTLDRVTEVALDLMKRTRYREPSIAAADLWEGIKRAQLDAVSQASSPTQALDDQNTRVQRALDQAWVFAPR